MSLKGESKAQNHIKIIKTIEKQRIRNDVCTKNVQKWAERGGQTQLADSCQVTERASAAEEEAPVWGGVFRQFKGRGL